jgi:putative N-acetyltransferase (TIGR04045 family)
VILEPVPRYRGRDLAYRPTAEGWEIAAYLRLRRRAFCDEQRLFDGDDRDAVDERALFLVALARTAGVVDDVVGGVRVWQEEPGCWWGGRLVTDPDHRGAAGIAQNLVRLAVATACRRGCVSFRATVQAQNVPLFARLGWRALGDLELRGAPHVLMAADVGGASS